MKRHFELEEICFDEYNEICREAGLAMDTSQFSTNRRFMNGSPKRYAKLKEIFTYRRLANIIQDIEDEPLRNEKQRLRQIFTSPQYFKFSEVKRLLRDDPAFYLDYLQKNEPKFNEFVIVLARYKMGDTFYNDSFTYKKEDDSWILRKIAIHKPNYEFYRVKGLQKPLSEEDYCLKCILPR
ncbi:hypothetical protein HY636_02445 [Candidatus Woesearchaeota archaeon]|nr:hypothetical protein [Candidatus Woesearchaeota archaeon]